MAAAMFSYSLAMSRSISQISWCIYRASGNSLSATLRKRFYAAPGRRFTSSLNVASTQERTINTECHVSKQGFIRRHLHCSCVHYSDFTVVPTPNFPESVSEGDVRWGKGVGDEVAEDEVIAEIETDKTSLPVMSPTAGIIEELLVPDGEKVVAGQDLFKIRTPGGAPTTKITTEATSSASTAPSAPTPAPSSAPGLAGEIPATLPATPPLPTAPIASVPVSQVKVTPSEMKLPVAGGEMSTPSRTESRVKMNRMRQRIAQRLKEAQNTCAMLTTFNELDMSNIMVLRNKYKDQFNKKHNLKLGFMSAFLKASAYSLHDMPVVNAVIDGTEIVYRDFVDISVAVATPKGLVVPVLRNVDQMNFADIERGLSDLGEKARSGNLAIEDMDGGTFTVSNGGVFGSMMGTPIINPPQSAILGMHGIFDRPVAVQGKVEIRPMMYIALTYDHRLIDGREAVTFLKKIKSAVEDPSIMFMDL